MKRAILAALALLAITAGTVTAAPPVPTGTIEYASVDATIGGEVTFTTTTSKLRGNSYPMVYLHCEVDGRTVYGQLDYPDATFILGGGSSPWIDPNDPDYLAPATCSAQLLVYPGPTALLDETEAFAV